MTNISPAVNTIAPLKNVAAFNGLLRRVIDRSPSLPGMACFFGRSGLGKTQSAIFGANTTRAIHVDVGQFTTAKYLIESILLELGVSKPRGSIPQLIEQTIGLMAMDRTRPLIVDEAHWIAHKKFVDVLKQLHDGSLAPVILIGEETLPKQLEAHERVHNRMLEWVGAEPCGMDDAKHLVRAYCADISIKDELLKAIIERTGGNTRRIVVNLARVQEEARRAGKSTIGINDYDAKLISSSSAPSPRRAA